MWSEFDKEGLVRFGKSKTQGDQGTMEFVKPGSKSLFEKDTRLYVTGRPSLDDWDPQVLGVEPCKPPP